MRDLQACLPNSNGTMGNHNPPPPSPSQPSHTPFSVVKAESWCCAELATQELIHRIQPTRDSEQRRKAVVEYVQMLIGRRLGAEVSPFGSVPLKTYLPDGDIDLTALAVSKSDDTLAHEIHSVLEIEEQNKEAEFEVKDVQYIQAEVRLVKCLVQNIVVDISFNQIGGLCTLCFLEKVDLFIGKDNLFKRSIILIKAWCYYESRILGAHHGLISTYALEILVLYIFHLFYSSLDGPLAVLYRFLDYYSKFDWDNYCISLHGPISVCSLPELVAEVPENDGSGLLLTKDFLENCVNDFSDPLRGLGSNSRSFSRKHLNIVDPLKESNNLGRSVSKGNFYRIRSAFSYGARKLGQVLLLPAESIAHEVNMFFTNTLDRHGSGERPDVHDMLHNCSDIMVNCYNGVGTVPSEFKIEKRRDDKLISGTPANDSHQELCEDFDKINISGEKETVPGNWLQTVEGNVVSGWRMSGHASDLSTSRIFASKTANGNCKALSNSETGVSPSGQVCYAPHLLFHSENGIGNEISTRDLDFNEEVGTFMHTESYETESSTGSAPCYSNHGTFAPAGPIDGSMTSSWSTYLSEYPPIAGIGINGNPTSHHLPDLNGDYDMFFNSLQYAHWYREYYSGGSLLPSTPSASALQYRSKYQWDAARMHNMYAQMSANGTVPSSTLSPTGCYQMNSPAISGTYGMEDIQKPRGIGTYFPNANYYHGYKEKSSSGRGRPTNQLPRSRDNGRVEAVPDTNLLDKGCQDPPSLARSPVLSGNDREKPSSLDTPKSSSRTSVKGLSHVNGFLFPSDKFEFGNFGPVPLPGAEAGKRSDSGSPHSQISCQVIPASIVQRPISNPERPKQSYQLKDDADFPPLTG